MKNLLITSALCLLLACNTSTKESTNQTDIIEASNLTFQIDTIKKRYGTCDTDTSIYCTQVNFAFPVFAGTANASLLNRLVKKELLTIYLKDSVSNDLDTHAESFIADYKNIKERFEKAFGWQSSLNSEIIRTDSNLLVMETIVELYTGGAHGTYEVYYSNIDTAQIKLLKLEDVFSSGFESTLNELIKQEIGASTSHNLDTETFYNSNFGLLDQGVKFYFNAYEIAPYADGPTEVFISYDRLNDILKSSFK